MEAKVQSKQLVVFLDAASPTPFEQDLKMISTRLSKRDFCADFRTFIKL